MAATSATSWRAPLASESEWILDVVRRSGKASGFVILPRCWVVKRTFAWLCRSRRLAKDWEATIANARILTRRIARQRDA